MGPTIKLGFADGDGTYGSIPTLRVVWINGGIEKSEDVHQWDISRFSG